MLTKSAFLFLILLTLVLVAPLVAQPEPAPLFTVSANSSCNSPDSNTFTCLAANNLIQNWELPSGINYNGCTLNTNCHFEYCFAANPPATLNSDGTINNTYCNWQNTVATTFTLNDTCGTCGNVKYTVYGEYRLIDTRPPLIHIYYSTTPTSNVMNLDETQPTVSLNSPAGLANSDSHYANGVQTQSVNGTAPQWISWLASTANPNDSVIMTISGCATGCTTLANNLVGPPFSGQWPGSIPVSSDTYLQLQGTDEAGLQNSTTGTTPLFSIFDPTGTGGTPTTVSCGPHGQNGTQPCLVLAEGTPSSGQDNDITGDPPAGDSQGSDCNPSTVCLLFSGYTDPCIRADTAVNTSSNPYGTNVYMTYSYPVLNQSTVNQNGFDATFYSQAVEIHLASSDTGMTTSKPSGQSWCAGDASNCGTEKVLFPSLEVSTSPPTFSSHEVSNIWEVPNYPNSVTNTWFAVQLTYWVIPPASIPGSITSSSNPGCLVVSWAQGTPAALAWPSDAGSQPTSCTNFPSSLGVALTFANLTSWAGLASGNCPSWGQPAIMVTNQITPSGGTSGHYYMYLAAACLGSSFDVLNYYVLYTDFTASQALTSWSVAAGPFNYGKVDGLPGFPNYSFLKYITQFDWFMRPDGTVGAIFTPVTDNGGAFANGCLAANFNPVAGGPTSSPNNPFSYQLPNNGYSGIIANVTDADSSDYGGTAENIGSGSCAYDPISNGGIVLSRRLTLATPPQCAQNQANPILGRAVNCPFNVYTLVDSGVLP